jgi:hypothetical protein
MGGYPRVWSGYGLSTAGVCVGFRSSCSWRHLEPGQAMQPGGEWAREGARMEQEITIKVDGAGHRLTVDTRTTLLYALRERLGIPAP